MTKNTYRVTVTDDYLTNRASLDISTYDWDSEIEKTEPSNKTKCFDTLKDAMEYAQGVETDGSIILNDDEHGELYSSMVYQSKCHECGHEVWNRMVSDDTKLSK